MEEGKNIVYTEDQKIIIDSVVSIIEASLTRKTEFVVKITGSAGTGKTTVVQGILKSVLHLRQKISVVAPTHKALSVIQEKTIGNPVKYKTLASLLKMGRVYNYETQETTFSMTAETWNSALVDEKIVVIDEASMVSEEQYNALLRLAKKHKNILIFLGDRKQLPPIGEESSQAVIPELNLTTVSLNLTEIIRQGPGNPILDVAHNLELVKSFKPHLKDNKGYLFSTSEEPVLTNLSNSGGSDNMKYLAWSNENVDKINTLVRQKSFGDNPEELYVGETIISQSTSLKAKNNEEIYIEDLKERLQCVQVAAKNIVERLPKKFWEKIPTLLSSDMNTHLEPGLFFHNNNLYVNLKVYHINKSMYTIKKENEKYYKSALQILKPLVKERHISWKVTADFENLFLKYKYAYAMTVHKS